MKRRILALVTACWLLAFSPSVAGAQPTEQALTLCSTAPDCRIITAATWLREGTSVTLTVRAAPNVRFELVAHKVLVDDDNSFIGLEPVGHTGELFTGADGVVRAELQLPALPTGEQGGLVMVSTAGARDVDVDMFGLVLPYGTSTPIVLGDGFSTHKPAGAALDLRLTGTIPGSQFRVEYEAEPGSWENITASGAAEAGPSGGPGEVSSITYFIPQGLLPEPYGFRLVNASTGAVVHEWEATPDHEGVAQGYREPVTAGSLGVELGVRTDGHPLRAVKVVSSVLGAAALGIVCIGVPLTTRRAKAVIHHD